MSREVHDVLLAVARPRHVFLSRGQRCADRVHARHDALHFAIDLGEHRLSDARHDAHADDDVGGVGQLHAELCHGRADHTHAVWQHVHGATGHRFAEQVFELAPHLARRHPVVRRAGRVLRQRADEGALFHARDVVGVGPRIVAAGPEILIELGEGAGLNQGPAQALALLRRTVNPVHGGRTGQLAHFFDPPEQVAVARQRYRHVAGHRHSSGHASEFHATLVMAAGN